MSTLLGGMVEQYSYAAVTFLQWLSFTPILCCSLQFAFS